MCGIVGVAAERNVTELLLEGLRRLEYRGYDSSGMAVIDNNDDLQRLRRLGKVSELTEAQKTYGLSGRIGIAHTRWATHGQPSESNAHPHQSSSQLAVVHNGIIENYEALREELSASGYVFESETDTETIVHLVHSYLSEGDLLSAVQKAVARLDGAYAIAVIDVQNPDTIVACRKGSPLVLGIGIGEHYIASDQLALLPVTNRFVFLEEGQFVQVNRQSYQIFTPEGEATEGEIHESDISLDAVDKGEYQHYMLKEIYDQPQSIADCLEGRTNDKQVLDSAFGVGSQDLFEKVQAVQIVACGTSYHAGLVAKYWIEQMARIPCQVEVASEVRYRENVVMPGTLFVTISQSGETADTLAALRETIDNDRYIGRLTICNVPGSSMVRESDLAFMTRAGTEIGVASTKAFTTQLTGLLMMTACIARRHNPNPETEQQVIKQLRHLPSLITEALNMDSDIQAMSLAFADKFHALYLGRGSQYPVALEGALKLKEISYIHAEAYPAGELKHGPLALVDAKMPVVAVAPNNELHDKLKSNLEEVRARGGQLFVFADEAKEIAASEGEQILQFNGGGDWVAPILFTVPLQLLSYHVAVIKGTDVDQPRNLAKSVTVE